MLPADASPPLHLHEPQVGACETKARSAGQRDFDQVVAARARDEAPRKHDLVGAHADGPHSAPTLLSARPRDQCEELAGAACSKEVDGIDIFEQEYWLQIQASHLASQEAQWRHVQERAEAEEKRMQGVRLRAEEAAKRGLLAAFLREQGFGAANSRRRRLPLCGRFTYPLHQAARLNDVAAVEVLLWAGADSGLEDSDGLTPLALASTLNRQGSHDQIVLLLSTAAAGVVSTPA